jgi:GT2 family glycosyltransferase
MKIWICIPVFNRKDFTLNCLASLSKQSFSDFSVVICDHGSTDGTGEAIRSQFPQTVVINADSSLWWTGAINRCIEYVLEHAAPDDALLTMNNDTELPQDYLANLAKNFAKYSGTIITSVVYDIKNGVPEAAGYRQNWLLARASPVTFAEHHLPDDINAVAVTHASGRGSLFPLAVFRQLGLFDEQHLPHYAADYDFTFKAARAGFKIYACQDCQVLSYVEETGMAKVMDRLSWKSFVNYFTSIRSPANLPARWWYGWNNCPKPLLPMYFVLDLLRICGGYFKQFCQR